MINRWILPISVLLFAPLVAFADEPESELTGSEVCGLYMSGRAVDHALLVAHKKREELRAQAIQTVAKLGIYVPFSSVKKARKALKEIKDLYDRPYPKAPADQELYHDELATKLTHLTELISAIIRHPKNKDLFNVQKAIVNKPSSLSNRYLIHTNGFPIEMGLALATITEAHTHHLFKPEAHLHDLFYEADHAFQEYRDFHWKVIDMKKARKGIYGRMTLAQLNQERERLQHEIQIIKEKYLDSAVLPKPIEKLFDSILAKAGQEEDPISLIREVHDVEAQLNEGRAANNQWQLAQLMSVSLGIHAAPEDLTKHRNLFRYLVIKNNRNALMPETDYQNLLKLEKIAEIVTLIISQLEQP